MSRTRGANASEGIADAKNDKSCISGICASGNGVEKRLAEIHEVGREAEKKMEAAKNAIDALACAMEPYLTLVSDKGKPLTDRGMGIRDMELTSGVCQVATVSLALLGRLLDERKPRSFSVAANDILVLGELARAAWSSFVLGTAASFVRTAEA